MGGGSHRHRHRQGGYRPARGTGAETGPWAAPRLRHRVARAQLGAHAGPQGRCLALSPGRGSKWPQPGSPLSAQILAPKYRSPGTRSSDSWGVARLQGESRKKRRWARGVSERRSARAYTDSQRRGRVGGRGSPRGTRGLSDTPEDAWPPSGHGQEGRARQSQPPGAWEDAAATVQTMHDRSPGHAHPVTPRLLPSEADASQTPPRANRDSLSTERWVLQMRGDVHSSSGALGTLAPSLPAGRLPDWRVPAGAVAAAAQRPGACHPPPALRVPGSQTTRHGPSPRGSRSLPDSLAATAGPASGLRPLSSGDTMGSLPPRRGPRPLCLRRVPVS